MQDRFKFRHYNKLVKKMTYYDKPEMQVCLNNDFKSGLIFPMSEEYEDNAMYMGKYTYYQQCTGLKDKNGKLIYEGDILTDGYHNMLVYYDQENCSFALQKRTNYSLKRFGKNGYERISLRNLSENSFKNHQLKIIGNIYENPELLNKEDK